MAASLSSRTTISRRVDDSTGLACVEIAPKNGQFRRFSHCLFQHERHNQPQIKGAYTSCVPDPVSGVCSPSDWGIVVHDPSGYAFSEAKVPFGFGNVLG